jgi:hypothetical protein
MKHQENTLEKKSSRTQTQKGTQGTEWNLWRYNLDAKEESLSLSFNVIN